MSPAFAVVPVIDLMGGLVVHARAGQRDAYRPLEASRIAAGPEPAAVVEGLLALHPFRRLYIADLDAILKRGLHRAAIRDLAARFPSLELWVDAGLAEAGEAASLLALPAVRPVLGSESQADDRVLASLRGEPRLVLSLDRRGAERLDPAGLFDRPALWPDDVIVMTLARVGSGQGPDLEALAEVMVRAGGRRIWAAGGVRHAGDLAALRALGCAGVLVATALHDGRLGTAELQAAEAPAG
jgi:phosphoribosylformimino-5-aminoimidazole carboxamide ribotide isomerase